MAVCTDPSDPGKETTRKMIEIATLRSLALSFPAATEEPHFEKTSFRVKSKIFATYDHKLNRLCIKLSEMDQDLFCSIDETIIYPVDNKWGKRGWTFVEMKRIPEELFVDVLTTAYREVASKKLLTLFEQTKSNGDDGH